MGMSSYETVGYQCRSMSETTEAETGGGDAECGRARARARLNPEPIRSYSRWEGCKDSGLLLCRSLCFLVSVSMIVISSVIN